MGLTRRRARRCRMSEHRPVPVFNLPVVERMVRAVLAYQIAPTADGLVQARRSDPVIRSVRVSCRHNGKEVPLGPTGHLPPRYSQEGELLPELPDLRDRVLELGIVPPGQPLAVEVYADLAVQVDVLVPGDSDWRRCHGNPPWRVEFAAGHPGGTVRVVARNASNAEGVVAESIPLRVIPELDFRTLRFPGFTPHSLRALTEAITESRPTPPFDPTAFVRAKGSIEESTRAIVSASSGNLAGLHASVASVRVPDGMEAHQGGRPGRTQSAIGKLVAPRPPHLPQWPRLDVPYPDLPDLPRDVPLPVPVGPRKETR
jgi:hypothetical protein